MFVSFGAGGLAPSDRLVASFEDDAYFYFQIARNVAHGHGFTFDGVHATNGFQPLWLFVLVPVFRLVQGDLEGLWAVVAIQNALLAASTVLVFRTLRARIGTAGALAAALCLVAPPMATRTLRGGMESALLVLWLVLIWRGCLELDGKAGGGFAPRSSVRRWLVLGALCALAFLTRLEALVALPALLWLQRRHLSGRAARLALTTPAAASAIAYLAWNRQHFGLWLPISGTVKLAIANGSLLERLACVGNIPWPGGVLFGHLAGGAPASKGHPVRLVVYVLLLSTLAVAVRRYWPRLAPSVRASGLALPMLVGLAMLILDAAGICEVSGWHAAPILFIDAIAAGALVHALSAIRWVGPAAASLATAIALARLPAESARMKSLSETWEGETLAAARWLHATMGADDAAGSLTRSGELAYFAHRRVINLDGLVNDAEFFRVAYEEHTLDAYLQRERVRWVVEEWPGTEPWREWPYDVSASLGARGYVDIAETVPEGIRPCAQESTGGCAPAMGIWAVRGVSGVTGDPR